MTWDPRIKSPLSEDTSEDMPLFAAYLGPLHFAMVPFGTATITADKALSP